MSLSGWSRQQQRMRTLAQERLEVLSPGTVTISGTEYGCTTSGVAKRKFLRDGREVESRELMIRLRKALHASEPTIGQVITYRDEEGTESEWRIAEVRDRPEEVAWTLRLYEPSDERA